MLLGVTISMPVRFFSLTMKRYIPELKPNSSSFAMKCANEALNFRGEHDWAGIQFHGGLPMKNSKRTSRRQILRMGAAAVGGGLLAQQNGLAIETPGELGTPLGPYGERSPYEKAVRWTRQSKTPETGSSFTPLQDSLGTLTPSSLHYERHHSGIPTIDPARHRLVIHGMVDRPLSLSVADIRRLLSITRTMVLECGGNSGSEWAATTAP